MADKDIVVNGVRIGPESNLVDMFRRAIQGESIFPSKSAFGPENGVVRVLGAAQGSDLEPHVREAIMTLLTDPDDRVRAGAVMALGTYPHGFDGRALLTTLDQHPNLFRGVTPLAQAYPDLEWELLVAIDATQLKDPKFTERLKAAVQDSSNGGWVVGSVTKADPDWVLAHAHEVVAGQADRVNGVLANLGDVRIRQDFLKALHRDPEQFRKDAAARLNRVISDPQERERLTRLLMQ